ncbi:DUF4132 domain-containing protein [Nonomuraea sp. NPDC050790]|uniref:DUF4132 domain-containing protein n=1 Tax=Nonomuraea sp. NPDC050790 TaxID=3364371 RepID=UPI00379BECD4
MSSEVTWVEAEGGYGLALDGGTLICRNAAGRRLKSVPKAVKDGPAAEQLLALRDHLARHEAECLATVESWMLGGHPVPSPMIAALWPDPAWREALTDLVVLRGEEPGLLRDAGQDGRLGVVDLDAETTWLEPGPVLIPHPVLLADLADLREFAAELGAAQRVPQLAREVHHKGAAQPDYAGGRFSELRHATARAARFGFRVRGGYAVCPVVESGRPVQARYWLGDEGPDYEAYTGDLIWVGADERPLDPADVGPVAWSEGVRMAELIYAGRITDGD